MKTETPQEQLKRIGKELEAVEFERQNYTHDNSEKGYQKWCELWDQAQELFKQYNKLKEKINAQSVAASSTTVETTA